MIPDIGLIICNSGASNTGTITGLVAYEIVKEKNNIGIFSLPALANKIPRQIALVRKVKKLIVVDGCKNECAKKIVESLGINYNSYINLGYDLGIQKVGPFTSLEYNTDDIKRSKQEILNRIENIWSEKK